MKKNEMIELLRQEVKETKKAHETACDELYKAFKLWVNGELSQEDYVKADNKVNEMYGKYIEAKAIYQMLTQKLDVNHNVIFEL